MRVEFGGTCDLSHQLLHENGLPEVAPGKGTKQSDCLLDRETFTSGSQFLCSCCHDLLITEAVQCQTRDKFHDLLYTNTPPLYGRCHRVTRVPSVLLSSLGGRRNCVQIRVNGTTFLYRSVPNPETTSVKFFCVSLSAMVLTLSLLRSACNTRSLR